MVHLRGGPDNNGHVKLHFYRAEREIKISSWKSNAPVIPRTSQKHGKRRSQPSRGRQTRRWSIMSPRKWRSIRLRSAATGVWT